ncbi:putative Haloacid dehalogenase-like hydrolase domain-containing protein 3 [uncultured Desulfobacterium sp.]|uniref:Putative Haloacid dehalogenase-like hydrolase domain-containing protein 3 n=1 Tax=uncultured Desulfobacterium sp. TaxID=201089 RepID=A0A445MQT9_9BACT|nr:putative Haloacid dehalogenase-like hydrolase domain-containing protein 3 [uncultured Desulfobacterium sp.]
MNSTFYSQINTLFLDVGNTLVAMDFPWIAKELAYLGIACQARELQRAEAAARPIISDGFKRWSTEGKDAFVFYLETVLSCLSAAVEHDSWQIKDIAQRLAPVLRPDGESDRLWSTVIPGVLESLKALKAIGFKLVAVSNSDGTVEGILVRLGIRPYFDAVYDSRLVGFEKPDPRIFLHAIEQSDADPDNTLHVGDLYNIDVVGARAAGIQAVLIDPFDDWCDVDCDRVRDLSELAGRILNFELKDQA